MTYQKALPLVLANERTGRAIAAALGMEVRAGLLPDATLQEIEALKARGPVVMMGNGINDAPALAAASVGVAVAVGLKLVFPVTTLAGVTGLWPAIPADTGATVLVTLNAVRLLRWQGPFATQPAASCH